ncbi:MAG: carboxypeptidase-like regulatory domain-containing protein, partial [Candidatus Aminicenantales bacterium]
MKKRTIAILCAALILSSFSLAQTAEIKGRVTLSPEGKPYGKGNMLLMLLGEDIYVKAPIDSEGRFFYRNLTPGTYVLKMDLYNLTPVEKEITILDETESLEITLPIT